ncbi:hypothetical protein BABINDRAFT_168205 [Babjeviella inositovora NRRL Y-12698]|uniref:Uncharacterized protein n=1 Tax=Babjeviella inositovora NRRL Y-12698 TaxID=984486 RepID=A0A1E3QMZ3_9ASCO|nr:uncharacterized protein BABINDRAFT_168205 [Babjeviella inositovora NRRL Y-12698]ODQ78462.1 hypothetical protein BABINDRAFT_168205 [Babjeviella inositovora NRRL Y-12698]
MSLVKRQKVKTSTDLINHFDDTETHEYSLDQGIWLCTESIQTTLTATFSPSSYQLASGGIDKQVSLWNIPQPGSDAATPNYATLSHKSAVTGISWATDEQLIAACADSSLNWWDATTQIKLRKLKSCHTCPGGGVINQISAIGTSSQVVSVGDDGCARLWDNRETADEASIEIRTSFPLTTVAAASDTVYISGLDPCITAYDLRKVSSPLWLYAPPTPAMVTSLSHGGTSSLFARSTDGSIQQVNSTPFVPLTLSRKERVLQGVADTQSYLVRCAVNGDKVISGGEDGCVTMWELGTGKIVRRWDTTDGVRNVVVDVGFDPKGEYVYGTLSGGGVGVWKV